MWACPHRRRVRRCSRRRRPTPPDANRARGGLPPQPSPRPRSAIRVSYGRCVRPSLEWVVAAVFVPPSEACSVAVIAGPAPSLLLSPSEDLWVEELFETDECSVLVTDGPLPPDLPQSDWAAAETTAPWLLLVSLLAVPGTRLWATTDS